MWFGLMYDRRRRRTCLKGFVDLTWIVSSIETNTRIERYKLTKRIGYTIKNKLHILFVFFYLHEKLQHGFPATHVSKIEAAFRDYISPLRALSLATLSGLA